MKIYLAVFFVSIAVVLSGCGKNKGTETGSGSLAASKTEAQITTKNGNALTVTYDESLNPNDVMKFVYSLKSAAGEVVSGTIHWGDNSDTRIRGEGVAYHRYVANGEYKIAVQPDSDEKVATGTVRVSDIEDYSVDGKISDNCRITGFNVTPLSGTIETNARFRVIVDFEVYHIRFSPAYNPPFLHFSVRGKIYFEDTGRFSDAFDSLDTYTYSQKRIDKGQVVFEGKLAQTNSEYGPSDYYGGYVGFLPGSYLDEANVSIFSNNGETGCNVVVPLLINLRK